MAVPFGKQEMKQSITKKQWNELSDELKLKYLHALNIYSHTARPEAKYEVGFLAGYNWENVTIGQMIEYLGDDYILAITNFLEFDKSNEEHRQSLKMIKDGRIQMISRPDVLCDDLWKAVVKKANAK